VTLQALQAQLDRVLHVPITFTLGGEPSTTLAASPAVAAVAAAAAAGLPPAAPVVAATAISDAAGPPTLPALAQIFTVKDAWREWQEGLAGQPPLRELEERWGSRWRPGNAIRIAFSRRKVIWDEISTRVARGKSVNEVVAELEQLRASQSLNWLVEELKRRRQYVPPTLPRRVGRGIVRGQPRRGQPRRGPYGRWGRRGGPPPRQVLSTG